MKLSLPHIAAKAGGYNAGYKAGGNNAGYKAGGNNAGHKAGEGVVSFLAQVTIYVSTVSGTQTHPSSERLGSLAVFSSNAAVPTDMLASGRIVGGHIEGNMPSCPNPITHWGQNGGQALKPE